MNLYRQEILDQFQNKVAKELNKVSRIKVKDTESWVEWSTKMDTLWEIHNLLMNLEEK